MSSTPRIPTATIRYLYLTCNDLLPMRRFYTELLGLTEGSFRNEGDYRWLTYRCGGFELMIFPDVNRVPVLSGWSAQPGWEGGTTPAPGWSVWVPFAEYAAVVERIRAAGVETFSPDPQWCQDSYWGWPLRDPMGNTVEVYSEPPARPSSTVWPGTAAS
jgi:hypothetical protein